MTDSHPMSAAPMLAAAGWEPTSRGGETGPAANAAVVATTRELPVLRDFSARAR